MKDFFINFINILTVFITVVILAILVPYLFGIKPTIVTSGSMEPTLSVGSLCMINTRYDFDQVDVNDIIVYRIPNQKVIHRVVGVYAAGVKTKGDANEHIDSVTVTKEIYYGKYITSIPKIGYLTIRLQTPTGKTIFVSSLIVLYVLDYLLLYAKKRGKTNGSI